MNGGCRWWLAIRRAASRREHETSTLTAFLQALGFGAALEREGAGDAQGEGTAVDEVGELLAYRT